MAEHICLCLARKLVKLKTTVIITPVSVFYMALEKLDLLAWIAHVHVNTDYSSTMTGLLNIRLELEKFNCDFKCDCYSNFSAT